MVYNFDRLKTTMATDYTDPVSSAQKKFTFKNWFEHYVHVCLGCMFLYLILNYICHSPNPNDKGYYFCNKAYVIVISLKKKSFFLDF